jgi:heparosan-N-sulfate-glucuronate 5-epimerase
MMKRQVLFGLILASLLYSVCSIALKGVHASATSEISATNIHLREPCVFFDKQVYCPKVDVFWNQAASIVPIKISVKDRFVGSPFVKVKIFSSLDTKKVVLMQVGEGRFEGSVLANCLRYSESAMNESQVFNVKYGDKIVAKYQGQMQAVAFIAFPRYVLDNYLTSTSPWKLFDSEGVPLVNYGYPIGIQYNPVTVSQYALANYHVYLATGNSSFRETFLVQADWLVKNAVQKGNFSVWEYKFDWSIYTCTQPWVSGMAQGQGISVLTRAYFLTGNKTYLDVAQTAVDSFAVEMSTGGVRYTDSSGGVWYEEYADIGAPSSKVLNGFIFALLGLYEYSFATNSSKGYTLFWQGVNTLAANVHRYDTGSWSCYDLLYRFSVSVGYHLLHVDQLMTLYNLTGEQTFKKYSDKFHSYLR